MKNLILIIALFLGFNASSQSYKIIGNDTWIDAMFYFEVTDSHNGSEMSGIKVQMFDGGRIVATTYTNNRGRALFIIKGPRYLESDMTFKIQKQNYSPWSHQLGDQWDVLQFMKKNQIGIRYKNSQGLNRLRKPTSRSEDIAHILNGNFTKGSGLSGSYSGNGPGMMQFKVSLNYDRHPSERRGYNSERNNNENSNSSSSSGNYRWIKSQVDRTTVIFSIEKIKLVVSKLPCGYSLSIREPGANETLIRNCDSEDVAKAALQEAKETIRARLESGSLYLGADGVYHNRN